MDDRTYLGLIQHLIDETGGTFGMGPAERARLMAGPFIQQATDDDLERIVADGISVHLNKAISYQRSTAGKAQTSAVIGALNGEPATQTAFAFLSYPIVLPGDQVKPLRRATMIDLQIALHSVQAQRRGIDRTIRQLSGFITALAGLPDYITVEDLLRLGVIDVGALADVLEQA